ncbi:MAG: DUF5009 domain-containing protein [Legionella sp.]|nr:MAG: DUF5009 domain-containing protein [Legionella sp.]
MQIHSNRQRIRSLDVFRGITIAVMILVNTVRTSPYATLKHSDWNGCTLADLVFPCFLFVMGLSLVLSLSKQIPKTPKCTLMRKIIRRAFLIGILGLILNIFPQHMTPETFVTLRFFGVLQRIALCYLCASFIYLTLSIRLHIAVIMLILASYWLILVYVPVPGYGAGQLSPEGNMPAYIDRMLFGSAHLYGKVYDPEGFLSTLPAITTTLLGSLTGFWLLSKKTPHQIVLGVLGIGTLCLIAGWFWGQWFPINKALWTSSYVLWTGGWALYGFAACYWLIEIKQYHAWSKPFEMFGLNAIIAYFLHVVCLKIQYVLPVTCDHSMPCHLYDYILQYAFGWTTPLYGSLYYGFTSVLFWLFIVWILYRYKIFIRV